MGIQANTIQVDKNLEMDNEVEKKIGSPQELKLMICHIFGFSKVSQDD